MVGLNDHEGLFQLKGFYDRGLQPNFADPIKTRTEAETLPNGSPNLLSCF